MITASISRSDIGDSRGLCVSAGESPLFVRNFDSCHLSNAIVVSKFNAILFDDSVVCVSLGSDRRQE